MYDMLMFIYYSSDGSMAFLHNINNTGIVNPSKYNVYATKYIFTLFTPSIYSIYLLEYINKTHSILYIHNFNVEFSEWHGVLSWLSGSRIRY